VTCDLKEPTNRSHPIIRHMNESYHTCDQITSNSSLNLRDSWVWRSRLLKITRHFCKRALWKRLYSAKETYNLKEPTNRSHPIIRHMNESYHTREQVTSNTWTHESTTHCNTLQHTVTHCNTLQHIATHCSTLQHAATHTATHSHEWVISHMRTSHVTLTSHSWVKRQTHESCGLSMSHVTRVRQVSHTHESRHTCASCVTHTWVQVKTPVKATCYGVATVSSID